MICSSENYYASCSGPQAGPERTSNWLKPVGQGHFLRAGDAGKRLIAGFSVDQTRQIIQGSILAVTFIKTATLRTDLTS